MPSKLRMKDTEEDIEKLVKRERRERKRRRKEEARHRDQDSMTPPRRGTAASGQLFTQEELDYDESALPPEQAYKPDRFEESLAWAETLDQGIGFHEEILYSRQPSAAFSYDSAASVAMGKSAKTGVDAMDDEEYAEWVRAGMWYRKNKDEAERQEAAERARQIKEEKERLEKEKLQREEKRRIQKLEAMSSKRRETEYREARTRYDDRWKKLLAPVPPIPTPTTSATGAASEDLDPPPAVTAFPLRFTDFPWPLYPPVPFPPISWPAPDDVTPDNVSSFLLSHLEATQRKGVLRAAVLAYHPDRFDRLVARIPEDQVELRERVRELDLRVSQELNELLRAAT